MISGLVSLAIQAVVCLPSWPLHLCTSAKRSCEREPARAAGGLPASSRPRLFRSATGAQWQRSFPFPSCSPFSVPVRSLGHVCSPLHHPFCPSIAVLSFLRPALSPRSFPEPCAVRYSRFRLWRSSPRLALASLPASPRRLWSCSGAALKVLDESPPPPPLLAPPPASVPSRARASPIGRQRSTVCPPGTSADADRRWSPLFAETPPLGWAAARVAGRTHVPLSWDGTGWERGVVGGCLSTQVSFTEG